MAEESRGLMPCGVLAFDLCVLTFDLSAMTDSQSTINRTAELVAQIRRISIRQFALGPISLEARAGDLTAIIGPTGQASRIAEILSDTEAQSGGVLLDGQNLHRLAPRERARRVGLARQDTILLFSFEVPGICSSRAPSAPGQQPV